MYAAMVFSEDWNYIIPFYLKKLLNSGVTKMATKWQNMRQRVFWSQSPLQRDSTDNRNKNM